MERIPGAGAGLDHEDRSRTPRPASGPVVPVLDRPVFVVAPPCSGAALVLDGLARSPEAWTLPADGSISAGSLPGLGPAERGWESGRLDRADAYSDIVADLARLLATNAVDRDGARAVAGQAVRLVVAAPEHALQVPFLAKAFPDARFVYVYRDPGETVGAMVEGWRSGRAVTHPDLPGWAGPPWSYVLPPGWRELPPDPVARIAAEQWRRTVEMLLDDLGTLPGDNWCVASHDRLRDDARAELERLCGFCELAFEPPPVPAGPPPPGHLPTPYPSGAERRSAHPAELDRVLPSLAAAADRARAVLTLTAEVPASTSSASSAHRTRPPANTDSQAFSSVATSNLAPLLRRLGITPILTTYQSGRLIAIRADGNSINTHFRVFDSPMGVAVRRGRLALGTKRSVWEFRNVTAVAAKIEPPGSHDACFLPSRCHVTGDIAIHEMVYVGDQLWVVNTRFSCLATLDGDHSFRPRWRPPFVTGLSPQDRCHLNGAAIVDGAIRYVTALGVSDVAGGWREHKTNGGVLLEVPSGEIVSEGLSMPHSPRWHEGRLWVLESGEGRLCSVDPASGARRAVAEVPGFARGLAFAGPLAFIGLSQVRESVFGGIPIAVRLPEEKRACGMWVVDTRSGATVAFLRFDGAVQEVFDLQLLHGIRYPELIEPEAELTGSSFVLPDEALADVQL